MPVTKGFALILIVLAVLWLLWAYRDSFAGRIAFSWLGPRPVVGERRSSYRWRWALYSCNWLAQMVLICGVLNIVLSAFDAEENAFSLFALVALTFGSAMALFAFVFFALSAAKILIVGPDDPLTANEVTQIEDESQIR